MAQRLSDVSRLISRLLLEISDTDRLYSAISAANMQRAMEDSVKRQHQSLADLPCGMTVDRCGLREIFQAGALQ
ncbi:hypothetical protein CS369_11150 [Candidatus Symbiopectobacterium sp. 'North America']|uniref:hypothetical protein n=1 Tax=Candidatus Symbiopectobacterium sp. 'North America' TaxID=2794574 RepID=UPI0018CA5862|nr:hypothetical protein [Candidatus Symbiopectobacterium sp. 'North America']MBG6245186.1 hypothetical protein [Candidatus Symbiopectobacterium sp. 'North America']